MKKMKKKWKKLKEEKYERWSKRGYKIIFDNKVAEKVFNLLFFDFHDSTTLTMAYHEKKEPKYKPMGKLFRPHIYEYYSFFKGEDYLEKKPGSKDVPSKKGKIYPRKSLMYRIKSDPKPFQEYFEEKYNWKPSKQALFIIKTLLEYERKCFKWQYNENINIFENFRLFLKSIMMNNSVVHCLDAKMQCFYSKSHKTIRFNDIPKQESKEETRLLKGVGKDINKIKDDPFWQTNKKKIISTIKQMMEKGDSFVDRIKRDIINSDYDFKKCKPYLDKLAPHILDSDYNFEKLDPKDKILHSSNFFPCFLFNVMPEAYLNIVLGLFRNHPDIETFLVILYYNLKRPENKNRKMPITREIYNKIKI